jgi:dGTPase
MNELLPVSFSQRSPADKAHARQRVYREKLPIEQRSVLAGAPGQEFFEDLNRIRESRAHRRLQGIGQFSPGNREDFQNRLSHTLDVEKVGETIARALGMDMQSMDLIKAIANIHDIGHAPFAHAGEHVFQRRLAPFELEWNHDMAGLRVVAQMANTGLSFNGMNLTLATLEGLAKRYWRYTQDETLQRKQPHFFHSFRELPPVIVDIDERFDLHLTRQNHMEGQIAAIADWIAFTATDMEDGLRMGVYSIQELCEVCPLAQEVYQDMLGQMREHYLQRRETYGRNNPQVLDLKSQSSAREDSLIRLFAEEVQNRLMMDAIQTTRQNISNAVARGEIVHAEDVRNLDHLLVSFSRPMMQSLNAFSDFCRDHAFGRINMLMGPDEMLVDRVFEDFISGAIPMEGSWQTQFDAAASTPPNGLSTEAARTLLVCEYLTCNFNDESVRAHIQQHHPDLWEQHFSEEAQQGRIQQLRERGLWLARGRGTFSYQLLERPEMKQAADFQGRISS